MNSTSGRASPKPRERLVILSPNGPCPPPLLITLLLIAVILRLWWLLWQQPPNPVVDTRMGSNCAQPPWSLLQGDEEKDIAASRTLDSGVLEHWTSSPLSAGSSKVHWSSPNQSACAFWIMKTCLTASPRTSASGVQGLRQFSLNMTRVGAWFAMPAAGLWQGCPLSLVLLIIFMDKNPWRNLGLESVRFCNHWFMSLLFGMVWSCCLDFHCAVLKPSV